MKIPDSLLRNAEIIYLGVVANFSFIYLTSGGDWTTAKTKILGFDFEEFNLSFGYFYSLFEMIGARLLGVVVFSFLIFIVVGYFAALMLYPLTVLFPSESKRAKKYRSITQWLSRLLGRSDNFISTLLRLIYGTLGIVLSTYVLANFY